MLRVAGQIKKVAIQSIHHIMLSNDHLKEMMTSKDINSREHSSVGQITKMTWLKSKYWLFPFPEFIVKVIPTVKCND